MTISGPTEWRQLLPRLASFVRFLPTFFRFRPIRMLLILGTIFAAGRIASDAVSQPAPKIERIPLKECYSNMTWPRDPTTNEPEMKRISRDPRIPDELPAAKLVETLRRTGASQIFIVGERDKRFTEMAKRGPGEFAGFIEFTNRILVDGIRSADFPFDQSGGPYWLFVHFGNSYSVPPCWVVKSVEKNGKEIVVIVEYDKANFKTSDDTRPYFFWAPLGDLPAATYDLRVVDFRSNDTWYSRRTRALNNTTNEVSP